MGPPQRKYCWDLRPVQQSLESLLRTVLFATVQNAFAPEFVGEVAALGVNLCETPTTPLGTAHRTTIASVHEQNFPTSRASSPASTPAADLLAHPLTPVLVRLVDTLKG